MMQRRTCVLLMMAACWAGFGTSAQAWDDHRDFVPWIMKSLPENLRQKLEQRIPIPCPASPQEDTAAYKKIAAQLLLNPHVAEKYSVTQLGCGKGKTVSAAEIFVLGAVDEPDFGMDKDLEAAGLNPEQFDPENNRKFMGGTTGPTSQGFRHMHFGGWKVSHPIRTFQIPTGAIGLAPSRTEVMANHARALMKSDPIWAYRLLGWAMHYTQDLAQPYHSVQVPHLLMPPWSVLFAWPPSEGQAALVRETTRTISNYHFAYERYVKSQLAKKEQSLLAPCLSKPADYLKGFNDPVSPGPRDVAYKTIETSIAVGGKAGSGSMGFFGKQLKDPAFDLPQGKGDLNYEELASREDLKDAREKLHAATCTALANAIWGSRELIEWVTE